MNPIVLITGASGSIGCAVAALFAQNGYAVAMQYHAHREPLELIASRFSPDTPYQILPCDLTDAQETRSLIDHVHRTLGRVYVLINCAGIAPPQMLYSDTTDDDLHGVFGINVYAPMRLTRLLDEDLRLTKGNVINIMSMWGITGASCEVIYSASKAALMGFTKALAKELAPCGVRVNAIAPGFVPSQMNAHLSQEEIEAFRMETPLQRLGKPKDIASAAFYLASADFVTGQVLSVDGGIVI